MKRVNKRLDRSENISRLITWLSHGLASRRGLPILTAIILTVVALILNVLWVITDNKILGIAGITLLHIAIFTGFLGLLLAEPLGRG